MNVSFSPQVISKPLSTKNTNQFQPALQQPLQQDTVSFSGKPIKEKIVRGACLAAILPMLAGPLAGCSSNNNDNNIGTNEIVFVTDQRACSLDEVLNIDDINLSDEIKANKDLATILEKFENAVELEPLEIEKSKNGVFNTVDDYGWDLVVKYKKNGEKPYLKEINLDGDKYLVVKGNNLDVNLSRCYSNYIVLGENINLKPSTDRWEYYGDVENDINNIIAIGNKIELKPKEGKIENITVFGDDNEFTNVVDGSIN